MKSDHLWIFGAFLTLNGCVSITHPHERFIKDMNTLVSYNATIDELSDQYNDPEVQKKYLTKIEKSNKNFDLYFYKKRSLWGYCHYYFIVQKSSKKLIGWGFDTQSGDPENCGHSG